ncbi:hypothetical protein [Actinophytocola sp.]|uniref:hypothetical protein n=1 Tax=Actinophytocola sp. TaxID=1872138 RepID=UPI002ED2787F
MEVDPPCSEFGSHPEGGHTLQLRLRIATGNDAKVVDRVDGISNPFSFVEIDKDSVTRDTNFGMCADPSVNKLPDTHGPTSSIRASWTLKSPRRPGSSRCS